MSQGRPRTRCGSLPGPSAARPTGTCARQPVTSTAQPAKPTDACRHRHRQARRSAQPSASSMSSPARAGVISAHWSRTWRGSPPRLPNYAVSMAAPTRPPQHAQPPNTCTCWPSARVIKRRYQCENFARRLRSPRARITPIAPRASNTTPDGTRVWPSSAQARPSRQRTTASGRRPLTAPVTGRPVTRRTWGDGYRAKLSRLDKSARH